MTRFIENPPDASALMTSARSFGNYDLSGALADLIDNCIDAKAANVDITCRFNGGDPEVRVLDNGSGMSREELCAAMRPASRNPNETRSPDELGRFGWGMKSASLSQCRRLTVLSHKGNSRSGAVWDLDDLAGWKMGVLSEGEFLGVASEQLHQNCGTEIVWSKCDRLSENYTLSESDFNRVAIQAAERISLVFHKYLNGDVRRKKLSLTLNGEPLLGRDPFHSHHPACQKLEEETVSISRKHIVIKPYVLPHFSKLRSAEYENLSGKEGFLKIKASTSIETTD